MTRHISNKKVRKAWVEASVNVLEFENKTSVAMATGSAQESVKLCVFATIVPGLCVDEYMNRMTTLHNELIKTFPQVITTKPKRKH